MADLITRAALARMLGLTVEKLYKRQKELEANPVNPLPGPVLGNMSGARWDPAAIERWIAAGGEHAPANPATTAPLASAKASVEDWGAQLDSNARRLAVGG